MTKSRQRIVSTNGPGRGQVLSVVLVGAVLAFSGGAFPQNTKVSAHDLLRRVVNGELKAQADDHSHWMYQTKAAKSGNEEVRWVVETPAGDLDRVLSINGKRVTAEQEKQEDRRIEHLLHKTEEQKKRQRAQAEDSRQTEHLFKMLPDAVLARYGEQKGDLVEIVFGPNPDFRPSSREDVVFHAMEGRILVDDKEERLVEIDGHLSRDVKFVGGLLGHLDKGGEFRVRQSEVADGHWEVTLLHVNMNGKALFFKTIAVQQNEIRTNFRRVPDNMTLAQAAEELQRRCTGQTTATNDSNSTQVTSKQTPGGIR
jgi:hypothetical protein